MAKLRSWDTQSNSTDFYATIYHVIDPKHNGAKHNNKSVDEIAQQIYNCNLLDNAVRGSLGYLYGYTKDNGLDDSVASNNADDAVFTSTPTTTTTQGTVSIDGDITQDSSSVQCAAGTTELGIQKTRINSADINIRICRVDNLVIEALDSDSDESTPGTTYYINNANRHAIVNSRVSAAVVAMITAANSDGVDIKALSSYRSLTHQIQACYGTGSNRTSGPCNNSGYNPPGVSRHNWGVAIDFVDDNKNHTANCRARSDYPPCKDQGNATWDWLTKNASNFGFKQLPNESWHWSPDGQ